MLSNFCGKKLYGLIAQHENKRYDVKCLSSHQTILVAEGSALSATRFRRRHKLAALRTCPPDPLPPTHQALLASADTLQEGYMTLRAPVSHTSAKKQLVRPTLIKVQRSVTEWYRQLQLRSRNMRRELGSLPLLLCLGLYSPQRVHLWFLVHTRYLLWILNRSARVW